MSFNANLTAVALANLDRMEKPALVPGGPEGMMPVDQAPPPGPEAGMQMTGGAPPGMGEAPPTGGMPPDVAAEGAGAPPGPGAGTGSGDPLERLASIEGKIDQLIGVLNGFLLGQQAGGGGSKGGGSGGSNQEMLGLMQQIASALGVQSPAPAGPGAAPIGPLGAGMPGQPAPPGGPLAPATPDGMTVSAADESRSPADAVSKLLKNFKR